MGFSRRTLFFRLAKIGGAAALAGGVGGVVHKIFGGEEQPPPAGQISGQPQKSETPAATKIQRSTETPVQAETPGLDPLNQTYVDHLQKVIDELGLEKGNLDELVENKDSLAVLEKLLDLAKKTVVNPKWTVEANSYFKKEDETNAHRRLREEAIGPLITAMRTQYKNDQASLAKISEIYDKNPADWQPDNQKESAVWQDILSQIPGIGEGSFQIEAEINLSLTVGRDLYWPEDTGLINACETRGAGPSDDIINRTLIPFYRMVINGETRVMLNGKEEVVKAPREYSDYEKGHARENLKRCGVTDLQ